MITGGTASASASLWVKIHAHLLRLLGLALRGGAPMTAAGDVPVEPLVGEAALHPTRPQWHLSLDFSVALASFCYSVKFAWVSP